MISNLTVNIPKTSKPMALHLKSYLIEIITKGPLKQCLLTFKSYLTANIPRSSKTMASSLKSYLIDIVIITRSSKTKVFNL